MNQPEYDKAMAAELRNVADRLEAGTVRAVRLTVTAETKDTTQAGSEFVTKALTGRKTLVLEFDTPTNGETT